MEVTTKMAMNVLHGYRVSLDRYTQDMLREILLRRKTASTKTDYAPARPLSGRMKHEFTAWLKDIVSPYLPDGFWHGSVTDLSGELSQRSVLSVLDNAISKMHLSFRIFFKKALDYAIHRDYDKSFYRIMYKKPKEVSELITGFVTSSHRMKRSAVIAEAIDELTKAGRSDVAGQLKDPKSWLDDPDQVKLKKEVGVRHRPMEEATSEGFYIRQDTISPLKSAGDIGFTDDLERDKNIYELIAQMLAYYQDNEGPVKDSLLKAFRTDDQKQPVNMDLEPEEAEMTEEPPPKEEEQIRGRKRTRALQREELMKARKQTALSYSSGATETIFEPRKTREQSIEHLREKSENPEAETKYGVDNDVLNWLALAKQEGHDPEWEYVGVEARPDRSGKTTVKFLEFKLPEYNEAYNIEPTFVVQVPPAIGFIRSFNPEGKITIKKRDENQIDELLKKYARYHFTVKRCTRDFAILDFKEFKDKQVERTLKQIKEREGGGITATQLDNFFTYLTYSYINKIKSMPAAKIADMLGVSLTLFATPIGSAEHLDEVLIGQMHSEVDKIRRQDHTFGLYRDLEESREKERIMQQERSEVLGENIAQVLSRLDSSDSVALANEFVKGIPYRVYQPRITLLSAFYTQPLIHWVILMITDKNSPIKAPHVAVEDLPEGMKPEERQPWRLMVKEVFDLGMYPTDPVHRGFLESVYMSMVDNGEAKARAVPASGSSEKPDEKEKSPSGDVMIVPGSPEAKKMREDYNKGSFRLDDAQLQEAITWLKGQSTNISINITGQLAHYIANHMLDLVARGNPKIRAILDKVGGGARERTKPLIEMSRQMQVDLVNKKKELEAAVMSQDVIKIKKMFSDIGEKFRGRGSEGLVDYIESVVKVPIDFDKVIDFETKTTRDEQPELWNYAYTLWRIYEQKYRFKMYERRNEEINKIYRAERGLPPESTVDEAARAREVTPVEEFSFGGRKRAPATPATTLKKAMEDIYMRLLREEHLKLSEQLNKELNRNAVHAVMNKIRTVSVI